MASVRWDIFLEVIKNIPIECEGLQWAKIKNRSRVA
jgi:hypothetical protein